MTLFYIPFISLYRALQNVHDIFGMDFDFNEFDKYGDDYEDEDELDDYEYDDEELEGVRWHKVVWRWFESPFVRFFFGPDVFFKLFPEMIGMIAVGKGIRRGKIDYSIYSQLWPIRTLKGPTKTVRMPRSPD